MPAGQVPDFSRRGVVVPDRREVAAGAGPVEVAAGLDHGIRRRGVDRRRDMLGSRRKIADVQLAGAGAGLLGAAGSRAGRGDHQADPGLALNSRMELL